MGLGNWQLIAALMIVIIAAVAVVTSVWKYVDSTRRIQRAKKRSQEYRARLNDQSEWSELPGEYYRD